jgi:hypothetical protein
MTYVKRFTEEDGIQAFFTSVSQCDLLKMIISQYFLPQLPLCPKMLSLKTIFEKSRIFQAFGPHLCQIHQSNNNYIVYSS